METANKKVCPSCGKANKISNEFCEECGVKFSEANKFEIKEHLKGSLYGSIVCIVIFIAFMIMITIILPIQAGLIALIPMAIGWVLTIGFLFWARKYLKGLSKFRRFTITDKFIEIVVPHKPYFRIDWSEFDSIEIRKRSSQLIIPTSQSLILGPRFVYFNLVFAREDTTKNYEFESGKDFKVKSRKKLVYALEEWAEKLNKEYNGPKR
ncbi:MAG: hypothetical protein ACFFGP_09275 [Promethearchaeota archaeon]